MTCFGFELISFYASICHDEMQDNNSIDQIDLHEVSTVR